MPRKEPAKGIHTSPEKAGRKNMGDVIPNDDDNLMGKIITVYNKGDENLKVYKGLWDEDTLQDEIKKYLEYCTEVKLKASKVGLALWLGISKSQYWEWETKPEKYGYKSNLIKMANQAIEMSYIGSIEKYPTGNIFLLKTSHDHIEASKVDVTSNGKTIGSADDINDLIKKLGLDGESKPE